MRGGGLQKAPILVSRKMIQNFWNYPKHSEGEGEGEGQGKDTRHKTMNSCWTPFSSKLKIWYNGIIIDIIFQSNGLLYKIGFVLSATKMVVVISSNLQSPPI